jgi:hypothetical protein
MPTAAALLAFTAKEERKIVAAFRSKRALSGASAQPLPAMGLREGHVLKQMVSESVLRKAGPERYFLDETALAARGHMKWRTVLMLGILLVLVAVLFVLYRLSRSAS